MKAPLAALAAALVAIASLSGAPPAPLRGHSGILLPRPGFLHALFAAQQNLVADYFWILTTHKIGDARTAEEMRDVYAYADMATTLDPDFLPVYWFAGVALPIQTGRHEYQNAKEAIAILEKGAARAPGSFKIRFLLAQHYLHLTDDKEKAARMLVELSRFPNAPSWLPELAARVYAHAGAYDAALEIADRLAASAEDEETRAIHLRRKHEIQQEMILDRLDEAISRFQAARGRPPSTIQELVSERLLERVPPDPLGGEYYVDPDSHRAMSTASKHRFELIEMKLPPPADGR